MCSVAESARAKRTSGIRKAAKILSPFPWPSVASAAEAPSPAVMDSSDAPPGASLPTPSGAVRTTGGNLRWKPMEPVELAALLAPQYEVISLLGAGGMGAVYKGRQPRLNRIVAIKLLPPDIGDDPQFAGRFEREAQ